jgi:hypothetical protein
MEYSGLIVRATELDASRAPQGNHGVIISHLELTDLHPLRFLFYNVY